MPSATWTPAALSSEARGLGGDCWRVVEAQHRVSTLKLVDTLDEQALLEELIEESKPAVPPDCRHLDFLLFTPFRYTAPYPHGSRFRRAGYTPGVFYAAEAVETALAELSFYRLLFFSESPDTPLPANPGEYTAFRVAYRTGKGLDLTAPPFDIWSEVWRHPTDYGPCQDLADAARREGVEAIRYASVRDPAGGANLALLSCRVFRETVPTVRQTWRLHLRRDCAQAICEFPRLTVSFAREEFADPRLA